MSLITSLFSVSSGSGRAWCRPTHKTNQFGITGGNACCICIPASATSFVIEMWGQGGGGSGSCCCMGSPYGGQAGDYAYVTCSTSNTAHTLCVCVCNCACCAPGTCGSPGQTSIVCDCSVNQNYTAQGGGGGCGICNFSFTYASSSWNWMVQPQYSPYSLNCCWICLYQNSFNCQCNPTWENPSTFNYFRQNLPYCQVQGTDVLGCANTGCNQFSFYVKGSCGYSNPDHWITYASDQSCGYNQPLTLMCGGYAFGMGGWAYAGGASQCCDCGGQGTPTFGGVNGNAPGGGGKSSSMFCGPGSCCLGSCGGLGVVLISWQ